MNRKTIALIILGAVLLASLLAGGYFGVKAVRRTRLRHAAMAAYEKKEYILAERLLRQYLGKDPNAEAEVVALANIYHEFGDAGKEAQMWQTAGSLNPLNREYRENMLTSAMRAAGYGLLYSALGRKTRMGERLNDRELCLYVISACRSGHRKDADDAYKKGRKDDPGIFRKTDLGRFAEFLIDYSQMTGEQQEEYLNGAMRSEDPETRFEALNTAIARATQENAGGERIESLLKQAVETNSYAGTPLLADFYFSRCRFEDAAALAEPYLKSFDDLNLYLLYAESCAFTKRTDDLKALEKELRRKPGSLALMADYSNVLTAYLEDDVEKLAGAVRKSVNLISSPLFRFIRLSLAVRQDSFNEILSVANELFYYPPFYDLHDRALGLCMNYLIEQMRKPENQNDPSRMASLAKVLAGNMTDNRLLTDIILCDQCKKGLAKESDLRDALRRYPDDLLLFELAAEQFLFTGKTDQALALIEQAKAGGMKSGKLDFLHMIALDRQGDHDEAAEIFQDLLEQSEFNEDLVNQYFQFCVANRRSADLSDMADTLESMKDGKMEHVEKFFRAAALLSAENEAKENETLDMLASVPAGDPDYTFYAANRLYEHGRLDEAEAKYKSVLKTYRIPSLVLMNLSEIYRDKGETAKALETAKEAFDLEKESILPAFIYARRLSEAGRYEEAVKALDFPRRAVNYREDIVALWAGCMRHVIEKSMADKRYPQAEEQCRHLLYIMPDDELGPETLEKIRTLIKSRKYNSGD